MKTEEKRKIRGAVQNNETIETYEYLHKMLSKMPGNLSWGRRFTKTVMEVRRTEVFIDL